MFALFLLFVYAASTQATYYIDDGNSSISYTPANSWVQDPDGGAFDETLTYVYCTTSDNCQMQIPFTGSGITLYVAHESDNVNVTTTVDRNSSTTVMTKLLNNSTLEQYNITVYNIQSLAFGSHEVTVQLLTWVTGGNSSLWFDYAAVNTTQPSLNAAASPSSSALSGSSSSESHSHSNTGAIVGGVVGGLAALTGMIVVFFCLRRVKHKRNELLEAKSAILVSSFTDEGSTLPYPFSSGPISTGAHSAQTKQAPNVSSPLLLPNSTPSQHLTPMRLNTVLASRSPSSTIRPLPSSVEPQSGAQTREPMRSVANVLHDASYSQLTDEQIDFVTRLASNNVPATDIARVMERMRSASWIGDSSTNHITDDNQPILPSMEASSHQQQHHRRPLNMPPLVHLNGTLYQESPGDDSRLGHEPPAYIE